jgi:phage shock protein E
VIFIKNKYFGLILAIIYKITLNLIIMTVQEIISTGHYSLLDVREPMELVMDGEIAGATNIPLGQVIERADEIKAMAQPCIIFCRSGNRSGQAVQVLGQMGFENLHNGGGYNDLAQLIGL